MEEYLREERIQEKAIEALGLLMAGHDMTSAALTMGWKEKSVKDLLRNAYKRIGVKSFAQFKTWLAEKKQ